MFQVLIVGFWLATLGWFGQRELRPRLFPGQAPPFVIELADEATSQGQTFWTIYRGEREIGKAKTSLRYSNEDDTFELTSELKDVELTDKLFYVYISTMTNRYRVGRNGELRSLSAHGELRAESKRREERRVPGPAVFTATASFEGHVVDGKLLRTEKIVIPIFGEMSPKLEAMDAPNGNILNPMHPVSRVTGLRPGRRWRMPVFNPMADAVNPTLQAAANQSKLAPKGSSFQLPAGPVYLDAEVLSERPMISWNGREYECYIIEYRSPGDEQPARTYVRVRDGLVLRQEAFTMGERFTMQRE
jgi:hypothetical protein